MSVRSGGMILIAAVLLYACAPAPQVEAPATSASTPPAATAPPAVGSLPCAEVDRSQGLSVAYPVRSLYQSGAVLPGMEGLACLDALSAWLQGTAPGRWQVTVGAEAGTGFEPLVLAGKRQELLQRYFLRKGIDISGWTWQPEANGERQLQLTRLP